MQGGRQYLQRFDCNPYRDRLEPGSVIRISTHVDANRQLPPAGAAIIDWHAAAFAQFHDAELLQIELSSARNSKMLIP